jgi:hypothetical protein
MGPRIPWFQPWLLRSDISGCWNHRIFRQCIFHPWETSNPHPWWNFFFTPSPSFGIPKTCHNRGSKIEFIPWKICTCSWSFHGSKVFKSVKPHRSHSFTNQIYISYLYRAMFFFLKAIFLGPIPAPNSFLAPAHILGQVVSSQKEVKKCTMRTTSCRGPRRPGYPLEAMDHL